MQWLGYGDQAAYSVAHLAAAHHGREHVLTHGPAVDAVLASIAVPGVLPAVPWEGRELMDGAVANSTPGSAACAAGATTVYVLHSGHACALPTAARTAVGTALHPLSMIQQQRLVTGLSPHQRTARLLVVPPMCPLAVSPADFGHADELIDRARRATARWLAEGTPAVPGEMLQPHSHTPD